MAMLEIIFFLKYACLCWFGMWIWEEMTNAHVFVSKYNTICHYIVIILRHANVTKNVKKMSFWQNTLTLKIQRFHNFGQHKYTVAPSFLLSTYIILSKSINTLHDLDKKVALQFTNWYFKQVKYLFLIPTIIKICVSRESNPDQLLGRQLCWPLYHWRLLDISKETQNLFMFRLEIQILDGL